MKLESPNFNHQGFIPSKYTCDGKNVNPELRISEVPEGTASLVLIVNDPDAPGKTFTHWTIWNINPKIKMIAENNVPSGSKEGLTDFGRPGYGGPCPPSGIHHYHFHLFALDTKLDLPSSASEETLREVMAGHILATAELIGLYQRKNN